MIAIYVGMFLGLVLGWSAAGAAGATMGSVLGFAMGMMWTSTKAAAVEVPADAVLVNDQRHLLCVPKGQVATATFLRDANTGRWLDVARCTLCNPEDQVSCQKRCLLMIRDTLPPRRHPVRIDAPADATT